MLPGRRSGVAAAGQDARCGGSRRAAAAASQSTAAPDALGQAPSEKHHHSVLGAEGHGVGDCATQRPHPPADRRPLPPN